MEGIMERSISPSKKDEENCSKMKGKKWGKDGNPGFLTAPASLTLAMSRIIDQGSKSRRANRVATMGRLEAK
jgi:hypothetical protein